MDSGTGPEPTRTAPDPTRQVYEREADRWRADRAVVRPSDDAQRLAARIPPGSAPVADLGCGPGWYSTDLVRNLGDRARVVSVDAARAMLELTASAAPAALRVQADLRALPFRRGALGGGFASKSYVHVAQSAMPAALADLHRASTVGSPVFFHLFRGDMEHGSFPDDDFPGRRFSTWPEARLRDVITGAGFDIDTWNTMPDPKDRDVGRYEVSATRARTLPDTVGPDMRLLVCGLNPSINAADAGVGFAFGGNRFWPAALAAGLVTVDRDPGHALVHHGIGMTDLVKRATPRADELTTAEYAVGLARVERLVGWLRPGAVCFVGLAGWRAAVDRGAAAGPQPVRLGDRPVYVMPSTSGLNARTTPQELADHLRAAVEMASTT